MFEVVKVNLSSFMDSFPTLSIPSATFAAILSYTGSSGEAFILWACVSTLDMILGVVLAIVDGAFSVRRLYNWVFKIFIQLLTIVLFAAILRMFAIASGVQLFFASWLLLFYGLMDFSSIMEKFLRLGFLPAPAKVLLNFMRRRSAKIFAAMVNEPRLEKEMREALGAKDKTRATATNTPE